MRSVKIIVAFHGAVTHSEAFRDPEFYVPIYGGKDISLHLPKILQEMQGDNEGENISWANPYIGEVTCFYWAAKHLDKIGNPEMIGLNHYRRLFPIRLMQRELEQHDKENYILTTTKPLGIPVLVAAESLYGLGELTTRVLTHICQSDEDKTLFREFVQRREYAEKNLFVIPVKEVEGYINCIEQAVEFLASYFRLQGAYGAAYTRLPARVMEFVTGFYLYKLSRKGYERLVTKYEYPWRQFA